MKDLLQALRPYQWSKNLLVFAALVFALELFEPDRVVAAVAAFFCFCAASSAVYLFNDIFDRERDRAHPEKRNRPIAAGRVGARTAALTAAVLALAALAGSVLIQPSLTWIIAIYFALQAAYSIGLKRVAILDALIVAAGFLLRAIGGAAAVQVPISDWLLMCTIFVAVFISFAKRRHEVATLSSGGQQHRDSLGGYTVTLLDQLIAIAAAATLLSYALYTTDVETVEKFGSARLLWTFPFVIYGLFRYLALVHRDEEVGDPSLALVRDRPLLITVVLWGLTIVALLYLR